MFLVYKFVIAVKPVLHIQTKQIGPTHMEPGYGSIGQTANHQIATLGCGNTLDVVRHVQDVSFVATILILKQHQRLVDRKDHAPILQNTGHTRICLNLKKPWALQLPELQRKNKVLLIIQLTCSSLEIRNKPLVQKALFSVSSSTDTSSKFVHIFHVKN